VKTRENFPCRLFKLTGDIDELLTYEQKKRPALKASQAPLSNKQALEIRNEFAGCQKTSCHVTSLAQKAVSWHTEEDSELL